MAPVDPAAEAAAQEKEIERWKLKQLIKQLESARGNGTSMITVMIPPKDQIALVSKQLIGEKGAASNIKSHTNRLSVESAITSVLARLRLYNRVPPNGLVVCSGTVMFDNNKEKMITIDLEPFKPVPRSMYYCDNKFHTEPLREMLDSDDRFGFIVVDGATCLYGAVCGNTREILHKFTVELPKKHGRGGQSAMRFARLRLEKRHNYLRKVAELSVQFFITNDRPNVTGLVLAGSADFKNDLAGTDMFDPRLKNVVLKIVDVAYGGENGFNQAVEASSDALSKVRIVAEKQLLNKYFEEIAKDTNLIAYGLADTIRALEMGAIERLIVWEELAVKRYQFKRADGSEDVKHLTPAQSEDKKHFIDPETGSIMDSESELYVEWLTQNYRKFGCTLELVTDKSSEGNQFVRGFGGLGGFLRYQVDFIQLRELEEGNIGGDDGDDDDRKKGGDGDDSSDFDEDDFM